MKMDELERIRARKMQELLRRKTQASGRSMPDSPIKMTDSDFESLIQEYPLMVVDCWATWCGPCRMLAPVIDELARDYAGKIVFGKLDVDENPRTAINFGIMSVPTLLIVKDGKLVDQIIGVVPRDYIESKLRKYM
jgi:thioredoxin 1